ncbi:MAG: glutamate synthase central domain-containing protein [Dorea sp.]
MITITQSLHGIVKIASKMGISTIQSYQGAKIFEAIGIDSKMSLTSILQRTVSRIGGVSIEDIENDVQDPFLKAFDPLGLYRRTRHWTAQDAHKMQKRKGRTSVQSTDASICLQQSTRTW